MPAHREYYPWFDWLRFGLACLVVLSHSGLIDWWPQAADFAVQVFFALSGWLIGGILVRLPREELPRFYFNRALRIWCPYFLALALLVTASLMHDTLSKKWTEIVFYKSTFVYNLFGTPQLAAHHLEMPLAGTGNHFWSVNAEEQFYLAAPLILVLASPLFGRKSITWIVLAVAAWLTGTYASIVLGVLASVIANTRGEFHLRRWSRLLAALAVIACFIGFVASEHYTLLSPLCAIAVVLLLAIPGAQQPLGALAGGMSYPLYLNAWIPVYVVNGLFKRLGITGSAAHQSATILLDLAMSAMLYLYFDRPILSSRRRLYTRTRGGAIMIAGYCLVAAGICAGLLL